jgi:hypothetical protein
VLAQEAQAVEVALYDGLSLAQGNERDQKGLGRNEEGRLHTDLRKQDTSIMTPHGGVQ